MKLLTHNLLQCNKKGVTNGFPLIIRPRVLKHKESSYDKNFVLAMIPKLEYNALKQALGWVRECPQSMDSEGTANEGLPAGILPELPPELPEDPQSDEEFLKRLHVALFDIELVEGTLVCPESGREFPVNDGIPNMLLNDDEV
mmetsp:Transcript_106804/g.212098  ORF Transcript_106804/g.212098 Transcript_106804/m.212098 type:complete len:143 (-) Transcript_106804:43-471(-)